MTLDEDFAELLAAKGLSGVVQSWTNDGKIEFANSAQPGEKARVNAIAAAYDAGATGTKSLRRGAIAARTEAERALIDLLITRELADPACPKAIKDWGAADAAYKDHLRR